MAYHNIQESKNWHKYPIFKMPYPFGKSKKWLQFTKIDWNWMSTHFSVDQITSLVYLVQDDGTILDDRDMNFLLRIDGIVYGSTLSG